MVARSERHIRSESTSYEPPPLESTLQSHSFMPHHSPMRLAGSCWELLPCTDDLCPFKVHRYMIRLVNSSQGCRGHTSAVSCIGDWSTSKTDDQCEVTGLCHNLVRRCAGLLLTGRSPSSSDARFATQSSGRCTQESTPPYGED